LTKQGRGNVRFRTVRLDKPVFIAWVFGFGQKSPVAILAEVLQPTIKLLQFRDNVFPNIVSLSLRVNLLVRLD
jgi:hypothetical protein